jgi:hypothetical protein
VGWKVYDVRTNVDLIYRHAPDMNMGIKDLTNLQNTQYHNQAGMFKINAILVFDLNGGCIQSLKNFTMIGLKTQQL